MFLGNKPCLLIFFGFGLFGLGFPGDDFDWPSFFIGQLEVEF